MEIKHFKNDKASYITFQNIYDDCELEMIWQEAVFLCHEHKLLDPNETGTDRQFDGTPKKNNKGLWVDSIYCNRNTSNYLRLYRKGINLICNDKDILTNIDINLKLFFNCNVDATLMSYYENNGFYESHIDRSCYTYVFWLFKEPKKFSGGNIFLSELNQTIDVKSNMAVLFPSWLEHEVDKISMCDTIEKYKCNGRFAFTTFFNLRD